jgi:hypothetical protein
MFLGLRAIENYTLVRLEKLKTAMDGTFIKKRL